MFMDQSATNTLNCTFSGNTASLLGGGLYRSYPEQRSDVRGCVFLKNSAGQFGGAIYEQKVETGSIEVRFSPLQPLIDAGSGRCCCMVVKCE